MPNYNQFQRALKLVFLSMSIAKFLSFIRGKPKLKLPQNTVVLPRASHCISRQNISSNAIKVLYRLKDSGYQAFLVGGCVRDMLLGREPKDFDVATNATPQQVSKIFRNGRLIGRRFKIVHILFRQEIIEVSTFRAYQEEEVDSNKSVEGMLLRDNVYGDIVDDAKRRDFTVNALFYNIADFSVIDFHDGLTDLKNGVLRIIGDPEVRYREDPVRMLRAVRFAAKLGFRLDKDTEKPIHELRFLLRNIAPARLFTEIIKLFLGGQALETFKQLRHYKLFEFLFPGTEHALKNKNFASVNEFMNILFADTDARVQLNKTVSPSYLTAALLWHGFQQEFAELSNALNDPVAAFSAAYTSIVSKQQQAASIPKNFLLAARTIWEMQYRMSQLKPSRCYALVNHPRFRAGYDFLQLRWRAGEPVADIYDWWTKFYETDETGRHELLAKLTENKRRKTERRKAPYAP